LGGKVCENLKVLKILMKEHLIDASLQKDKEDQDLEYYVNQKILILKRKIRLLVGFKFFK